MPLDQVVLAQAFQFEALLTVLEAQGRHTRRRRVLEEIKRLRKRGLTLSDVRMRLQCSQCDGGGTQL